MPYDLLLFICYITSLASFMIWASVQIETKTFISILCTNLTIVIIFSASIFSRDSMVKNLDFLEVHDIDGVQVVKDNKTIINVNKLFSRSFKEDEKILKKTYEKTWAWPVYWQKGHSYEFYPANTPNSSAGEPLVPGV